MGNRLGSCHFLFPPQATGTLPGERGRRREFWTRETHLA